MIIFLLFKASFPSKDRGRSIFQQTSASPRALVEINAYSWPPPPEIPIPGVLGPHLEKQHSLQTLSEGPHETELCMSQLPHWGFEATNRHSPKEARSFQVGRKGRGEGALDFTASTLGNHNGILCWRTVAAPY